MYLPNRYRTVNVFLPGCDSSLGYEDGDGRSEPHDRQGE